MVSWTKGIGDWWRDVMASWRQRSGGGGLPQRGEKLCKGRNLRPPVAFIVRGERERWGGPPRRWQGADVEPNGGTMAHAGFLSSGTLTGGPRSRFWKWRGSNQYGLHCSWASPLNSIFYFSNWIEFVNYENHIFGAPNFTKLCNLIRQR
jgi:hypothetical protein